jgi:hypothetical protein
MVPHDPVFVLSKSWSWSGLFRMHLGLCAEQEKVKGHLEQLEVEPRGIEPSPFVYPDISSKLRSIGFVICISRVRGHT